MKKRIFLFAMIFAMLLSASVVLAACGNKETAEYQVTVLNADESPAAGITVSWNSGGKSAGTATTDSNGVAKATLTAANYTVSLSGLGEEIEYKEITVGAVLSKVTITLQIKQVLYTVNVTDKSGAAASGVSVSWLKGDNFLAGTATTDTSGKAELTMDYGTYVILLDGTPAGNIVDEYDDYIATATSPVVSIALIDGVALDYSVTVKTEGGLIFDNQSVYVVNRKGNTVKIGTTDENGVFTWSAVASDYTVKAVRLPDGYTAPDVVAHSDSRYVEMTLYSSVISSIPTSNFRYYMGDIIHNYTFTLPYLVDNEKTYRTYSIADLLDPNKGNKKAVFINNWGINCSACIQEMPYMQTVYEDYKDDIEILAVSNYLGGDTNSAIASFYKTSSYTFPMMREGYDFTTKFGIEGWPTTIIIDRYGAIARIERGGLPYIEVWETLIERYISDDYVQTFKRGEAMSTPITEEIVKPDFVLPADHYDKINESEIGLDGNVVWFGSELDYVWPYWYDEVDGLSADGEKLLYASNSGKGNTISAIYAYVTVPAGKVFTFDYYCQTENLDIFTVYWDNKAVSEFAGSDPQWRTCYLFSELASGSHLLAFVYIKDAGLDVGRDNVFIKNIRFADASEIPEGTDMLRSAAYGMPEDGATSYPHYAGVEMGDDGYYHVILDSLENSQYAGDDKSPMLFANLMESTNWMSNSISELVTGIVEATGEKIDCTFSINGEKARDWRDDIIAYCSAASSSDLYGLVPVDEELYYLLNAFMKRVKETIGETEEDKKLDENEWLEICYFYSHYGTDGKYIGNPIIGLMEKTAISINEKMDGNGVWEADLTRVMYPFPVTIYTYTAPEDGLYEIQSLIPVATNDEDQKGAQVWLYNDETGPDSPIIYNGDERFIRDGVNEHNFDIYRYMYAGEKYYIAVAFLNAELGTYDCKISRVKGDSVTVLEPGSANRFDFAVDENGDAIVDENGNLSLVLVGAVDYEYDAGEDRYYALNSDGSRGSLIYLDVKYALAFSRFSLSVLVDAYVQDPAEFTALNYKMFDFSYRVAYFTDTKEINGEPVVVVNYNPEMKLTSYGAKYKDYTAIMKGYIDEALEAENDGLIPMNKEIKDILDLFIETRLNMLLDGVQDTVLDNEWLRFCWYYRTYDEHSR